MKNIKIEIVKIDDVTPASYNPRTISPDMLEKLCKGIQEFGWVEPIVINSDNTVIGGHQRLIAAKNIGMVEVPAIRVNLDKKREKALNLALNKLQGEWDYPKLVEVLGEFESDHDFDIELTGFDNLEALALADLKSFDSSVSFDGISPSGSTDGGGKHRIVQYTLIFNSEEERTIWENWLRRLKDDYPDCDSSSERVVRYIQNL
jgi:ParB-like chromosome segregation protein Spo0J